MRVLRKLLTLIGYLTLASAVFAVSYVWMHSMRTARPFELGQRGSRPSVLIATQGSAYKDAVTRALVSRLAAGPAHVKVIDVSELPPVLERDWDTVVLMFSWERWQAERHARAFIERCGEREKLVVLTTSGGGDERLPCVDTVTSASELQHARADAAELGARVAAVLARGHEHHGIEQSRH
jgi:hypothetical protein